MKKANTIISVIPFLCLAIVFTFMPVARVAAAVKEAAELGRIYGNDKSITRLENNVTGGVIEGAGPEYIIKLMDGTELTPEAPEEIVDISGKAVVLENGGLCFDSGTNVNCTSGSRAGNLQVIVSYWLLKEMIAYKKSLTICNKGEENAEIDSITVLKMSGVKDAYHGGFGEPIFAGDFFFGLEYPAGYNEIDGDTITLKHYPGKTLAKDECVLSKTAIVGAAPAGAVEETFKDYVESFRYSKSSNLHYNSWYDVREEGMSVEAFEKVFNGFRYGMEKYGVNLDYLVVDDGWQDRNTIWETSDNTFPDGFAPLRKFLEEGGTKFGLWLPYSGTNLNVDWGLRNDYEVNEKGRYYCVAGKKYNEQLRKRLAELIKVDGVRMFKHDFNEFRCYSDRVDYPQTERHSIEANVDAEIELMKYTHGLEPDLFLNVTSSMWLSPWWLKYADTIWMGSGDYGWDLGAASPYKRDWAMTYRDGWLYRRLVEEGHRFPMNAVMTHGIIDGVRNRLGGEEEGWNTWADNVILYFGRGVYMRELYISPQLMNDRKWKFLVDAAKWAKSMDPVFARTEWVGGDPRKAEAYGYHHYGGGQEWYILRNPDFRAQEISVDVPPGKIMQVVYPTKRYINGNAVALQGLDVLAIRVIPKAGDPVPEQYKDVPSVELADCPGGRGEFKCELKAHIPREGTTNLSVVLRSAGYHLLDRIDVNGNAVSSMDSDKGKGKGWRIFPVDISGYVAGSDVEIQVEIPSGAVLETPFAADEYTFAAYIETDGVVTLKDVKTSGILPPLRAPGETRVMKQTEEVPFDLSGAWKKGEAVSDEDFDGITEAKLRLKVFGSQGGEFKTILLNNALVGALPSNNFPHDNWEEFIVDIPQHRLGSVKKINKVVVNDMSEDNGYKFRDLQIAVKLADGTWRNTNIFDKVQCSKSEWEFAEGPAFNGKSRPMKLEF